jgi:homoserine dehydrogenase
VVSANKALICEHGAEIFATARKHGGHFFFEASSPAASRSSRPCARASSPTASPRIYGILNGTCNYILTQMEDQDAPYAEILADAKRLGYAEADESLDVEGWDTAHKAAVLALARPRRLGEDRPDDRRRHLSHHPGGFQERRHPRLRHQAPGDHQRAISRQRTLRPRAPDAVARGRVIANVNGVFNGISVVGDVVGTTTLHRPRRGTGRHCERGHQRHRGRRRPAQHGRARSHRRAPRRERTQPLPSSRRREAPLRIGGTTCRSP